ncbi:MAG: MBL fold metallo-hydrolase [Thaumarchaeota archaeon]|nr:MBL fold metallo-hydrolase [Nitrososphaerota archaeon]
MKVTQLYSASVLIQDGNAKILCDPWLQGEEYYGSWGMYPPYDFKPESFNDVDFIYISHIHPDHCSARTLGQLNKKIPVLIHNFPEKFLKYKIESLGFKVIELEHNLRVKLKGNLHINILAADNCNPEVCGKLMGCPLLETKFGTTQIDTMSVIDNEKEVIVNTNDCPYQIGLIAVNVVKEQYPSVDVLLVGYVKASSYPQCFDLDENEKRKEAEIKQINKLETSKQYIHLLKPKYYIPFAGRYTLTGTNFDLNEYRGEPELEYAYDWLNSHVSQDTSKGVILNHDEYFDVTNGTTSSQYTRIDPIKKVEYEKNVLSQVIYDYESQPYPSLNDIVELIPKSYDNFEKCRQKIGWTSNTVILLSLPEEKTAVITCNGHGYDIVSSKMIKDYKQYLAMHIDSRLLRWLLQGPRKTHWSLADIGCHIKYKRVPNVYERALYYCWNFFYSNKYD